jgi:beta-lactamase superfamily II metal-dependent hydrolase
MRRLAFSIWLFCGLVDDSTAAEPYAIKPDVEDCVNVRTDSSTDATVIACLEANATVTVLNSRPYWREIDFGQPEPGWIAKKFIVPITAPPTDPVPAPLPNDMWMTVHFIDVGQGDAIWIHTADDGLDANGIFEGKNIVIDGGPYSANSDNPILDYLKQPAHNLAVLDALIVTHPHIDHYAGAEALTRRFEVEDYYDSGFPGTSSYNAFIAAFNEPDHHVNNTHIGPGSHGALDWGNEITAEFLYTWPGQNAGLGQGSTLSNNASMVLKVTYGSQSFLFMGDAEGKDRADSPATPKYVEKRLIDGAANLKSTVLKIAHHGSETSSTTRFIKAVNPDLVIVQSGRKCFSGTHIPDMTTLIRYCAHNPSVRIFRTDEGDAGKTTREAVDGDHVVLRTNGHVVEVLEGTQAQCADLAAQTADQSC